MSLDQEIHVFDFIVISNNTLQMISRMWSPRLKVSGVMASPALELLYTYKFVM